MQVDLDDFTLVHNIKNNDELASQLIEFVNKNPTLDRSDVLSYDEINNNIERKINSCYFSAFHAPLIISMRYSEKAGHYLYFRLLKSKWLKDKLSLTYESYTLD
jgi:hypothetical protein